MNTQNIASYLLERRRRTSPVVFNGDVLQAIGPDGLQEALRRRWLLVDTDTGHLQVTHLQAHVQEMEAAAGTPQTPKAEACCESAEVVLIHANRRRIDEIAAPATGKPAPALTSGTPAPSTPTAAAPRQPTPAPTSGAATGNEELGVGDEVVIAQEGRTYTGRVSARTPQGRYRVSFGPDRPALNRDYEPGEVRRTSHGRA